MRFLAMLILLLSLTGCATTPLLIPCPEHHLPIKPDLPIWHLNTQSKPDAVSKAYVASVSLQQAWINAVYVTQ